MGNPDVTVVFNDRTVIVIKGTEYTSHEQAVRMALEKYLEMREQGIKGFYKAREENYEQVDIDFYPEGYWNIKIMRAC